MHDEGRRELCQLEICLAWDRIEQHLNMESFWYFLSATEPREPRIDLLFEIVASKFADQKDVSDEYLPFATFSLLLSPGQSHTQGHAQHQEADTPHTVDALWEEVERCFEVLVSLYEDHETYHLLGYLVATGKSLSTLLPPLLSASQSERQKILKEEAAGTLKSIAAASRGIRIDALAPSQWLPSDHELALLGYGNGQEGKHVRIILLLFNVVTAIQQEEGQTRFPFHLFHTQNWDVEHVNARANDESEVDDSLRNLVLLDASTNREYKDSSFLVKRSYIIQCMSKGRFIPPCTTRVLLKAGNLRDSSGTFYNLASLNEWDPELVAADQETQVHPWAMTSRMCGARQIKTDTWLTWRRPSQSTSEAYDDEPPGGLDNASHFASSFRYVPC